MNQARIGLLVLAAMIAAPSYAHAQKKKKPAAKPAPAAPAAPPAGPPVDAAAAGQVPLPPAQGPTEIDADAPPGGTAPAEPAATGEAPSPEPGDLGEICKIDPAACPTVNLAEAAKKDMKEQMYAVQQIYALRYHRFEIQPAWNAITMNDQFVSHPGPVVALNYYVTNVLAVGVSGGYYFNSDSEFNFQTRRAARVSVPLTEYQWQAALNFTYVPMYGKFAGFSDFIFHYDAYVVGGVGAISTRPIAVVDPDNRSFGWDKPKLSFNAGLGLRIFFNRRFAGTLEVRDYIFFDKLEDTNVSDTPADPSTWYGETKLTNNVQAQIGVSIFLPFSWEYRLAK
jgi:outer membrane beta-barrel protein